MLSPSLKNAIAAGNDFNELQNLVGPSNLKPMLDSCPLTTAADFSHFFGTYGVFTHLISALLSQFGSNSEQIQVVFHLADSMRCSTTFSAVMDKTINQSRHNSLRNTTRKSEAYYNIACKNTTPTASHWKLKQTAKFVTSTLQSLNTQLQILSFIKSDIDEFKSTLQNPDITATERAVAEANIARLNTELNLAKQKVEAAKTKHKKATQQHDIAKATWHKHILIIRDKAHLNASTVTNPDLCHHAIQLQKFLHNGKIENHTYDQAFIDAHPEQLALNEHGHQIVIEPDDPEGDGMHFMHIRRVGALQDQIEKSAGNSSNRMHPPSDEHTKALAQFLRKVTQLACSKAILAQSQSCVSLLSRTYKQLRPTAKQRYRHDIEQLQLQLNQLLHTSDPSIKTHQKLAAIISLCQQAHLRIEAGKSKFSRLKNRLLRRASTLNRRQTSIDVLATQLKQLHKVALPSGAGVMYTPENLKRVHRAYHKQALQSKLHTPLQIYRARKARNHSATRIQALARGVRCRQHLLHAPFLNPINMKEQAGTVVSHRDIAVAQAAPEIKP